VEHANHAEALGLMNIDPPMDMDRLQVPWDHEPAEICFDRAQALWDA